MEVTGRRGKLSNRGIPRIYSLPDVSVNTRRMVRWAKHVARLGKAKIWKENFEGENKKEDIICETRGYKLTEKIAINSTSSQATCQQLSFIYLHINLRQVSVVGTSSGKSHCSQLREEYGRFQC